jgi:cold shock CspA family protein/ribosome-associated translation inhibitor RaiA
MDRSEAIESAARANAMKLERFAEHIVSCRVTVEAPHKHHRQGKLFHVVVDVRLPGGELVVSRDPDQHHAHEDVHVALRDAFKAVRRQVQDYVRVQRGKLKTHEVPPYGRIVALHPDEDYGRIATPDGREIYFHRNSVVNADFDRLKVGLEVRISEEAGDRGPQASTVYVIGKHHLVG